MSADAKEFLAQAFDFQLGRLPTESRHLDTIHLSDLAQTNVPAALRLLQTIELKSLESVIDRKSELAALALEIKATLREGGRIYFCGCGATGRLSLSLETLWRQQCELLNLPSYIDKVFSFMAGGDYALIRSIEKFEDHFDYGAKQLRDSGFTNNDLLIASTEGGETPFVIGAVEEALKLSRRRPYFHYCNPKDLLAKTVERSRRVLENANIQSVSFETGPMALSGSTRLQASTALMLAAGACLYSALDDVEPLTRVESFIKLLKAADFSLLAPLILKESAIYQRHQYCIHGSIEFAMTVVTDTTERTPTFSLAPFENSQSSTDPLSWTYLYIPQTSSTEEAWTKLLGRTPRALQWPEFSQKYGRASLLQFDFSRNAVSRRTKLQPDLHTYMVESVSPDVLRFCLDTDVANFKLSKFVGTGVLEKNLFVKCALNFSSTLVMGRLGRFSSNLMLYVRATNNKLIDRAIRYVIALLEDDGIKSVSYQTVCETLFEIMPRIRIDEPVVKATYDLILRRLESKK